MSRSLKALRSNALASLRVHGPDQKGIVAACSHVLDKFGCGIVQSETWTDRFDHLFFQRMLFDCGHIGGDNAAGISSGSGSGSGSGNGNTNGNIGDNLIQSEQILQMNDEIKQLKNRFGLHSMKINWRTQPKKIAVFVSKYDHCLWEILLRHQARELDCDIKVVISNHPTLRPIAETFGIPFQCFPIKPENKLEQEKEEIKLLNELDVELIVLARYMQVLSNQFLGSFSYDQIINIHHSFLPAFIGRCPYHQAHKRGVKLIGATAHYVTEELDEGPIIDQHVIEVTHRDEPADLMRKGGIIERNVLANAVRAHLDDRIIPYKNKCVVFAE